jgi:hypothetical protein
MGDEILEQAASIVAQSETDNGSLSLSPVQAFRVSRHRSFLRI